MLFLDTRIRETGISGTAWRVYNIGMKTIFKTETLKKEGIFALPGKIVWCGSMAQDMAGGCHLYFSYWDYADGFEAWVTHSKIGYAFAESPDSEYRFRNPVLPLTAPEKWDRDVAHNPTVICENGIYYLYYTGNYSDTGEWWDHRNHQRIGVAWSRNPAGPFTHSAAPVIADPEAVMLSNPSVCKLADGRFLMIYKWVARHNPEPFYGPVSHGAALAERPEGPFIPVRRDLFQVPGANFPGEDPFVFTRGKQVYCLLKDNLKYYSNRSKALILFKSSDGIDWHKQGVAVTRSIPLENGRKRLYFRMERPQLTFCKDQVRLFCAAKPQMKSDTAYLINLKISGID